MIDLKNDNSTTDNPNPTNTAPTADMADNKTLPIKDKLDAPQKLGLLGRIGGFLESKTTKKSYERADLTQAFNLKDSVFYGQGASFGQQLLGAKGMTAHKLAAKIISQDKLDGIAHTLYHKIAHAAELWAIKSLSNDERFDRLSTLTHAQKDAFAQDIANQNRTLAALGGVVGFFGLKGVIVDTAWLLVVSLRTVYQLASIYSVSLKNTEDSIQLAYGVLLAANLDKLQEKQVILTALALGNTVLANANTANLKDEIKKAHSNSIFANYSDELGELAKYVNLEKYNLERFSTGWFGKILPLAAVGVGAYYNHKLIDEVIGTALATFTTLDSTPKLLDSPQSDT